MSIKIICKNRQAHFNYEIGEKFEGGLVLTGSEVKALRENQAHLNDSYAMLRHGELWLVGAHIAKYPAANIFNHEERRDRKILLKHQEIERLQGTLQEKGLSLIPLSLYFKGGRAKVELGIGKGKKLHDKRETIKRRESEREVKRITKSAQRH